MSSFARLARRALPVAAAASRRMYQAAGAPSRDAIVSATAVGGAAVTCAWAVVSQFPGLSLESLVLTSPVLWQLPATAWMVGDPTDAAAYAREAEERGLVGVTATDDDDDEFVTLPEFWAEPPRQR